MHSENKISEKEQIILSCKKGNSKRAFNKLYHMYAPKMLGVCMRYAKSVQEAEDILQEGFITVFRKIDTFGFKGSFDGWIRRVMVNTALNHYHKNKKYYMNELYASDSELQGESLSVEEIYNETKLPARELISLIQNLPRGYRLVFNLYVMEGLSHAEIASELNITESTSKSQLFKARAKLRKALEEKYGIKNSFSA